METLKKVDGLDFFKERRPSPSMGVYRGGRGCGIADDRLHLSHQTRQSCIVALAHSHIYNVYLFLQHTDPVDHHISTE